MVPSLGQALMQDNNANISLHPDTKEEADCLLMELAKAGTIEIDINNTFWGAYFGSLRGQARRAVDD